LYFLLFGLALVFLIPPFEANDEPDHLNYINFIVSKKSLPVQTIDSMKVNKEGHQFPLYYLSASGLQFLLGGNSISYNVIGNKKNINFGGKESLVPVYNHTYQEIFSSYKDKTSFYLLRVFQVLISLINLVVIYKIAGFYFHDEKFKLLTAFIAGAIPQFAFVSSYINNDTLANLFSSLIIFSFLNFLKVKSLKSIVLFSLILAVSLLIKKTMFFFLPVIMLVSFFAIANKQLNLKTFGVKLASILLFIAVISLWFFLRNMNLYNEAFLSQTEMSTVPFYVDVKPLLSSYFIYPFIPGLFGSFWGVFGWMNVALPFFVYVLLFLFVSLNFFFLLRSYNLKKLFNVKVLFAILSVIFCLGGVVYYNTIYSQHQGRFLFPVLPFIVIFLIYGIKAISEKTQRKNFAVVASVLLFVVIDVISLFTIYRFYYDPNNYL
jgi:hypothetical protein